jgi:peptidoglycan/xylan/chitin deacetylase (PgdA/CDA1 family)
MKLRYVLGKTHNILQARRRLISKFFNNNEGLVKVLTYHDIPENQLEQFNNHIKFLYDSYPFLNLDDFHSFLGGNNYIEGLHLLITFDDAFLSSKIAAAEILEQLGIKAVFFVTANFVGLSDEYEWKNFVSNRFFNGNKSFQEIGREYAPMSKDDLLWLRDKGHAIGSHSLNHMRLPCLPKEELESEIVGSGDFLAGELKIAIDDFAYPFGDIGSINAASMTLIRRRYKCCFSGIRGLNKPSTSPMAIFRDSVSLDDTPDYLKFIVEDGLSVMYYGKSKTLRNMAEKLSVG